MRSIQSIDKMKNLVPFCRFEVEKPQKNIMYLDDDHTQQNPVHNPILWGRDSYVVGKKPGEYP